MRRPSARLQAGGGTLKDSLHLVVEFLRVYLHHNQTKVLFGLTSYLKWDVSSRSQVIEINLEQFN